MDIKVLTPAEYASVECPKVTGKMDKNESCTKCEHYNKCYHALFEALGWEE